MTTPDGNVRFPLNIEKSNWNPDKSRYIIKWLTSCTRCACLWQIMFHYQTFKVQVQTLVALQNIAIVCSCIMSGVVHIEQTDNH